MRSTDEIAAILGVPILGAVPSLSRQKFAGRKRRSSRVAGLHDSEAFRAIRTALLFGAAREQATTILVTSPSPLEGKTTLVNNLGAVMAQAGQKTLIVDADLRKRVPHRLFGKNGHAQGLSDILVGKAACEEVIRSTTVDGLHVLPRGHDVPNPSELLSSPMFSTLLEGLKGSYDRILVDSPPVGLVTDAQIMASHIALTVVVLRAGRTTRMLTQRASDALLTVGARVAGVVVNDVSKGDKRYSAYSTYGYHGGYYGSNSRGKTRKEIPADISPSVKNGASTSTEQE